MMRNAALAGLAAIAAAFALPAQAWTPSSPAHARANAADHMAHAAALDPSDQEIARRIAHAIAADKAVKNAPVTVAVRDGNVTLAGPTENRQTVTRIEDDAAKVAGRAHVAPMV
jgi:osmotically-inducible protein OsmY